MGVQFFTSGREYTDLATPFLNASAVENIIPLTNLRSLATQEDGNSFLCLVTEKGKPRLAATMTAPYSLVLSSGDKSAILTLVKGLIERQIAVPGVFGRMDLADNFNQAWQGATGQIMRPGLAVALHATRQAPPARATPGRLRQAGQEDLETAIGFSEAFAQDPRLSSAERISIPAGTEKRVAQGEIFLWDDSGAKSIAACKESISTGGRLNLVYTPPEHRRHGYASACVAALTRHRFERGWDWCALFIDTSDPAASGMYRNLGFREVSKFQNYDIESNQQRGEP